MELDKVNDHVAFQHIADVATFAVWAATSACLISFKIICFKYLSFTLFITDL